MTSLSIFKQRVRHLGQRFRISNSSSRTLIPFAVLFPCVRIANKILIKMRERLGTVEDRSDVKEASDLISIAHEFRDRIKKTEKAYGQYAKSFKGMRVGL